ncbi:hypothetical protein IID62_09590, partial [candidate division KSB1 bacterium]|nr:hypothetical protein [candidate division KSB1 bacterium]
MIENIRKVLPKVFIRVWDNSPTHTIYTDVDEIRWNRFNPSLSRVWNWAIAQSQTDWVMITNDDIELKKDWLSDLEKDMNNHSISFWHGPSRCFLFHKLLLEHVGWFDERLTGFAYEDLDYIRRINNVGASHNYDMLSSLSKNAMSLKHEINRNHNDKNKSFFKLKYDNHDQEDFNDIPSFPTPDFYPC